MIFKLFKKALAAYLSLFLIWIPVANADPPNSWDGEEITALQEGEAAPFSGTLFSISAATRLMIDLEYTQKSCQIEIDKQLGFQKTELQLKIDNLNASIDSCNQRHEDILKIKNDQILFLDDQLKKANPNNKVLWFAIGIASGVVITGVAGWSLGQISSGSSVPQGVTFSGTSYS